MKTISLELHIPTETFFASRAYVRRCNYKVKEAMRTSLRNLIKHCGESCGDHPITRTLGNAWFRGLSAVVFLAAGLFVVADLVKVSAVLGTILWELVFVSRGQLCLDRYACLFFLYSYLLENEAVTQGERRSDVRELRGTVNIRTKTNAEYSVRCGMRGGGLRG